MTEITNIISMKLQPYRLLHVHTPKWPIIHRFEWTVTIR